MLFHHGVVSMYSRRRHVSQQGQLVVLVALIGTLILGVTALAVDIGVLQDHQRIIQNVADSAALAGARDLNTTPTAGCPNANPASCPQTAAARDALCSLQGSGMGWSFTTGGTVMTCVDGTTVHVPASSGVTGCTGYCFSGTPATGVSFTVSTPPVKARNAADVTINDMEVDITKDISKNGFAPVIGFTTSSVTANSVAYGWGPAQSLPWGFYVSTYGLSGNAPETVNGDAFLGDGYIAQSSGKAALCANVQGASGGHTVFALPQPAVVQPSHYTDVVSYGYNGSCGSSTGTVPGAALFEQASAGFPVNNCPNGSTWDSAATLCDIAAPVPIVAKPDASKTAQNFTVPAVDCGGSTLTAANTVPGVWDVPPSCNLNIDFNNPPICVSFILENGNTATTPTTLALKSGSKTLTSFGDPMGNTGGTACPGADLTKYTQYEASLNTTVFWAGIASSNVLVTNGTNGNITETIEGSIYMPAPAPTGTPVPTGNCSPPPLYGGTVCFNAGKVTVNITGTVTVNFWSIQSGAGPNPSVTYNPLVAPQIGQQLRLVE